MSNIIDLDVMVQEPIQFKIGGELYTIPGNPSVEFQIKFMSMDQKRLAKKDGKDAVELLAEMTAILLDQDESHHVSKEFVLKKLAMNQMLKIITIFSDHVENIAQAPN